LFLRLCLALAIATLIVPAGATATEEAIEVEGLVQGPSGEPIAEAKLEVSNDDGTLAETTDTDQAGRFRIPALPPGHYRVAVNADAYYPRTREVVLVSGQNHVALDVELDAVGQGYRTEVTTLPEIAWVGDRGASAFTLQRREIEQLPGGLERSLSEVAALQPGFTPDAFGQVHARGLYAPPQLWIDGVPVPIGFLGPFNLSLPARLVERVTVYAGGAPVEFGDQLGSIIDVESLKIPSKPTGEARILYGSYQTVQPSADYALPLSESAGLFMQGQLITTGQGLNPPSLQPVLNDALTAGQGFLCFELKPSRLTRLDVLASYQQAAFGVPVNAAIQPLSAAPPGAIRGTDRYGDDSPPFVPYDAKPSEYERDLYLATSLRLGSPEGSVFQVSPYFRNLYGQLNSDAAGVLGPTADPNSTTSDVSRRIAREGILVSEALPLGTKHHLKLGATADFAQSRVSYTNFNNGNPAFGGPNPTLAYSGEDLTALFAAGVYVQDEIKVGKLTLLPGARFDTQRMHFDTGNQTVVESGPSVRLGASYQLSESTLLHSFVGYLWSPSGLDAPTAARVLGLFPANAPVPYNLQAEKDLYAELGVSAKVLPRLMLGLTGWGRLSWTPLDDNEVGNTDLRAEYNYQRGQAAGLELTLRAIAGRWVDLFANGLLETVQGQNIASAQYFFTAQQLAYSGWQRFDHDQTFTANAGVDVHDPSAQTHLNVLLAVGSGLRAGPNNNETLPAHATFDLTLRHRFDVPLHPQVGVDVNNLFNVIWAYRIGNAGLNGSAYAPLRSVYVWLSVEL
jgi:hypothetical protein